MSLRSLTPGLYLLTAACGIIDATTFLALGMVFAEIMTGNLMFLAFGIGEGRAVESITNYVVPLVAFSLGAIAGGAVLQGHWARGHKRFGYLIVFVLLVAALGMGLMWAPSAGTARAFAIVALLALAMGLQNALVLDHAVPDVATNVMTLTLVRLLASWSLVGGDNKRWHYRLASLTVFFVGAMAGAFAVRFGIGASLGLAVLVYLTALPWLLRGQQPGQANKL